jgi:membrane protein
MLRWIGCGRLFATRISRRFIEERFAQLSASLAYTTLLSIVPLVAVILGIMSMLPFFPALIKQLEQLVAYTFLPERNAGMIITYVLEFSQKATKVTVAGVIGLVVAVLVLLLNVERAFNHVWRVEESRPWWKKVALAATVVALWPFVVAAVVFAVYHALTTSLGFIDEAEWLREYVFKIAGLAVAAAFFAALYATVPNARVAARDALPAGLVSASLLILMQKAFGFYLSLFSTFTLVYGAFATVPIFLVWLYLSWAVVLLGALVAASLAEFRA